MPLHQKNRKKNITDLDCYNISETILAETRTEFFLVKQIREKHVTDQLGHVFVFAIEILIPHLAKRYYHLYDN